MKTYHARIAGLCPVLDGVIVEVVEPEHPLIHVSSYVHQATVLKLAGQPVASGGLTIPVAFLSRAEEIPVEDLALDNPFGVAVEDESWIDQSVAVRATRYVNALHVNIRNTKTGRTLADQILWGTRALTAWGRMQDMIARGEDPLDFLFELKEITNG